MSVRTRLLWLVVSVVLVAGEGDAQQGRRRALLVGINDYTASRLRARPRVPEQAGRHWPNLNGATNDVAALQEMLVLLHDFHARDIVTLTDQAATRSAIVQSLEQLATTAAKNDVLLFYFAGHGSQVRNSLSDESDRLDETLVPADSRLGVRDIRDKELRRIFNRIVDRSARLTVILDNCHSGSGARGLMTGARPRGVDADLRDLADRTNYGPRPEERGALIVSAAQDVDQAWETRDDQGKFHGAFSWAWLRAMRDAAAGEPAMDTFQRAEARLRAETPFQEPVISGLAEARLNAFLGGRTDRRADRIVIGVERIRSDGTVMLRGGWANGLSVGAELRVITDELTKARLVVTAIHGLGQSEARLQARAAMPQSVRSGALVEVVGWAASPDRPLRVWTPRVSGSVNAIHSLARRLADQAAQRGVRWVSDPADAVHTHLLRRGNRGWELLDDHGNVEHLGPEPSDAIAGVAKIRAGSSLFVQLPAPAALIDGIAIGPGTDREGIEPTDRPEEADYILVGRYSARRLTYAWVRPLVRNADRRKSGVPLRSDWVAEDGRDETLRDSAPALRDAVLRLRRIQAWHLLQSPVEGRWPYQLALRRARNGEWAADHTIGDEGYDVVLRGGTARAQQRYVYVFVIDSYGKSSLLFPRNGSVENRLPFETRPATDIMLETSFEVAPPYGVDTYFLLTSDERLPDPSIFEWNGVRTRAPGEHTPLEELLVLTGSPARGPRRAVPFAWSLTRRVFEAVPPRISTKTAR